MKRLNLILAALAIISISCQDQKKNSEAMENSTSEVEYSENANTESTESEPTNKAEDTSELIVDTKEKSSTKEPISGDVYMKSGEETDISCKCYCLDVNPGGSSELCLTKDEIYITARFESNAEGIDLYYVSPSANNTNDELPWDKFDKNIPVASLKPTPEGLKLDWKGFSIDGKLAVDYAIYGKKTLEGEYHIKN
ncbi:hypothetical protein [Salegentibacter chungangensis]|uniref:Lipoprotein n=1 Tax=Salegentibacter chungangensis TaxID=1335724 RepID=A0ABW3NV18_9FLAO